jgi:thiol-disulfide isomerase/thioredoxin
MMRTPLHVAVPIGLAVIAIAAGIAVWLVSPARIPIASAPAPVPTAPAGFSLTPLATPRPLPELHFTDGGGRKLTLVVFRGRVVLLNLWATWCVPCRKEMPALDRLQARLGSPAFEVVALSIDQKGLSTVQPFYKELGLKALRIYLDRSGEAAFELHAPGLPTSLVIDRQGREVDRVVGPADWDSPQVEAVIRKYLAESEAAIPRQDTDRNEVAR